MKATTKYSILSLLAVGILLMAGCSAGFKRKLEAGIALQEMFGASSVTVGTSTNYSSDKGNRALTTMTFSGVDPKGWDDKGLEAVAHLAAYQFMKKLAADDLKGDTHVGITVEMTDGTSHEFEYAIEDDLRKIEPFIPVADQLIEACGKEDKAKFESLIDKTLMPDSILPQVYDYNHYVDSVYGKTPPKVELKGIRFDHSEEGNLDLFSTLYIQKNEQYKTRYEINVDRKTNKVVYYGVRIRSKDEAE